MLVCPSCCRVSAATVGLPLPYPVKRSATIAFTGSPSTVNVGRRDERTAGHGAPSCLPGPCRGCSPSAVPVADLLRAVGREQGDGDQPDAEDEVQHVVRAVEGD